MPISEFPPPVQDESGSQPPEMRCRPPGPMSQAAAVRLARTECPAFLQRREKRSAAAGETAVPIVLASGRGSNLYDVDGNRYVDLAAGFGALLLGHGSSAVSRAIEAQADRIVLGLGDVYSSDAKVTLLERLAGLYPEKGARVLVCQSGGDAITAAMKTAVLSTGRHGVVAFEGGYHGLGYAPLSALGLRESYREPFAAQLNPHVRFVPYPRDEASLQLSLAALEKAVTDEVGAVIAEPILGRGGVVIPPEGFLRAVRQIAHQRGALFVADEIWTGLGRSGSMVRSTEVGAPADILCFGKGLGGGLPISACVASEAIMGAWARGAEVVHTSTHAAFPLACASALSVLDSLRFRGLVPRARDVGAQTLGMLTEQLKGISTVKAVRGQGMMLGVEFDSAESASRAACRMLEKGYVVLTGGERGSVMTWTPALNTPEPLLAGAVSALCESARAA